MAGSKEEVSVLAVFSMAFIILIKICKFHRAPLEQWNKDSGINLLDNTSLEYLILRYNMQVGSSLGKPFDQVISMDSLPRLKAWFLQHQVCIASSISGPASSGESVHQVGDRLLAMMLKKAAKSGSASGAPVNSSSSDDGGGKLLMAAWDILTAVPYVVDTLLTACGQNKLQPRELTTGLRELVDFCPGSLPGIISFLEAEVTRGRWKPASMNGKDWPSPAANLQAVEAEMREMLSSSGVNVPTCLPAGSLPGNVSVTLPLPLATLLSLTITFKLDKFSELILGLAGPSVQIIAGGSACTSVVAALWTQKVRRWHDFILLGSAEAAIKKDKHAAMQVLKSCFAVMLGTCKSVLMPHGGVGALLGHRMIPSIGELHPIPPGILFLRIIPSLRDMMFLPGEVLSLLVKSVREFVGSSPALLKSMPRIRSPQSSLALTMSRIAQASTLAASLVFVAGGSTLGQLLYSETLASWFTSGHKPEEKPGSGKMALLEGYAVAYFTFLSGALIWGAPQPNGQACPSKTRAINSHMKFIAAGLAGRISLACDPTTWKTYVKGLVSLVLASRSSWISCVDVETLRRIAVALRTWHEFDLAIALLESGGPAAMGVAGEFAVGL